MVTDGSSGTMSEPDLLHIERQQWELIDSVLLAAIRYIKLRDAGHPHTSPEGKRLNEAVKAYLQTI